MLSAGAHVPYGLRISPAELRKKHRPDWVAQPEGKYGAEDTMSGTDQSAGLTLSGFTMDMGQDQIGQSASGDA